MKHLKWRKILGAIERGKRLPHVDTCQACAARWNRAQEMFRALKPQTSPCGNSETLIQRVLTRAGEPRTRSTLKLRWALAAGFLLLFLAGTAALWKYHQSELDEQYAAILAGDLMSEPAGLNALMPRWSFTDPDPWFEDAVLFYEEKGE